MNRLSRNPIGQVFAISATIAIALSSMPAVAEPVRLEPRDLPAVGRIDERFQSYNIEMAEVIGGRFWRPYAKMNEATPDAAGSSKQAVALDPRLFATLPPADLKSRRLRVLARALGPAYVRVSGSWANTVYFQDDDNAPLTSPPEGFKGVLTRAQWRGVIEFSRAVDARLVTSFAINPAVRDAAGVWTSVEASKLVNYTHAIGGEIYAAQLFNEPNLSAHAGGPAVYDGPAFARDSAAFRAFTVKTAPKMRIMGPGDANPANYNVKGALSLEDMLRSEPRPNFDIFTYHFYTGSSQRCVPPILPYGVRAQDARSDAWLAITDMGLQNRKPLRDKYAPDAPIWLTETAGASCGGAPWHATYLDTFRYVDQMGRLAKQGVSAIFHNTLAASEYALIDGSTLEPRPSYWAALLWRRLMGTTVLDAGELRPGFHLYAHCLRGRPGGVSVLAINSGDAPATLATQQRAELYLLTAPTEQSPTVQLNGETLAMRSGDRLPAITPQRLKKAEITIPARSIGFVVIPRAGNDNCR